MVRFFKLIALCFLSLFIISCATKEAPILSYPSQNLQDYLQDDKVITTATQEKLKKDYLEYFFSPWNKKGRDTKKSIEWIISSNQNNYGYGENNLPNSKEFIESLLIKANFDDFPSKDIKAIITHSTNLRVLPTHKPRFYNPEKAGEGFPFDYWQNSAIYLGTPISVRHFTKERDWAYVESGFVSGWVDVRHIAILDKKAREAYKKREFIVLKKDNIPLYTKDSHFLENARIGMLLPIIKENKNFYTLQIFQNNQGKAKPILVDFSKNYSNPFPQKFSTFEVAKLAQNLIGEKYGWGGAFENRDCSMFLRDILGNFGIFLLRNSQAQMYQTNFAQEKNYIDLSDSKNKFESIKNNAIPFITLLGLKGHIMLYIGEKDGKLYALHDIWGLKTLQNETQEGREIIGKIAITSLDIGENHPYIKKDSLLIHRIYGIRNLFLPKDLENVSTQQ